MSKLVTQLTSAVFWHINISSLAVAQTFESSGGQWHDQELFQQRPVFSRNSVVSVKEFVSMMAAINIQTKKNMYFHWLESSILFPKHETQHAKKLDDGWPESEERCSEICKSEDGIAWSIKREIYQDISEKKKDIKNDI